MDITNILKDKIMLAVEKLENQSVLPKDLKKDSITVEKPKDESFGELSTNVSMVLAKQANIKPRNLAGYLIKILKKDNAKSLQKRILKQEHKIYPKALKMILN